MKNLKKALSFIEVAVGGLVIAVTALVAFSTFNYFNNTMNSTSSVTSLISKISDSDEIKKLKIDKANIISVAQVGLNTTKTQALNITFTGNTNLVAGEKGILVAYEASNLPNGTNTTAYDVINFTETDLSAPKIFLYSTNKLSNEVKGITFLGAGTLKDSTHDSSNSLPVFVYQHNLTK